MVESIVQIHTSNTPIYNHCQVLAAMPNCMHCAFIQQHAHLQQHHHQREKYLALLHYDSYCNVRWLIFFSLFFFQPHYNLLGLLLQSITDRNVTGLWTSALLCAIYWFIDFRYCQWVCLWGRWFIFYNFSSPFTSQYSCILLGFPLYGNNNDV